VSPTSQKDLARRRKRLIDAGMRTWYGSRINDTTLAELVEVLNRPGVSGGCARSAESLADDQRHNRTVVMIAGSAARLRQGAGRGLADAIITRPRCGSLRAGWCPRGSAIVSTSPLESQ
jgi:hypothetical protein